MNDITLTQQQLGKIGTILPGHTRYQCHLPVFCFIAHITFPLALIVKPRLCERSAAISSLEILFSVSFRGFSGH
jgi:hypothetical protein